MLPLPSLFDELDKIAAKMRINLARKAAGSAKKKMDIESFARNLKTRFDAGDYGTASIGLLSREQALKRGIK